MKKFLIAVIFMFALTSAFSLSIYIPNKNFRCMHLVRFWKEYTPDNDEYRIDTYGVIHFMYLGRNVSSNMFIIEY